MNPDKANKLRLKAQELLGKNQPEKALEAIMKSLDEHPDNPLSWQMQGLVQEACNYRNEAVQSFKEAIKRDKMNELSYLGIYRILRTKKDTFNAFQWLANLASVNPASPLLRESVCDVLETENKEEWNELFKVRPDVLVAAIKNASGDADLDFKYRITGLLKNVGVANPELFQAKALDIILELATSPDGEIRNTAFILLVAAYEASPTIMEQEAIRGLLARGVSDPSTFIQRTAGGLIRSILDYFPNYLAGMEDVLDAAFDAPHVADSILKACPSCPRCRSQDEVYMMKMRPDEKIVRFHCEACDFHYFKQPGSRAALELDKGDKKVGLVICPLCKIQILNWSDPDGMYTCSICNKWFSV